MKCEKHPNREVVAQCNNCRAGVCAECAQATVELREEYGTLCVSCYNEVVRKAVTYYEDDCSKKKKNIITSIVLYIIGLIMIFANLTGEQYMSTLLGVFLCGFYSAISGWKKGEAEHDEYERKHGISYNVTSDGIEREDGFFLKLIIAVLYMVVGVIATPINVIKNSIRIKKNKEMIEDLTREMARVSNI